MKFTVLISSYNKGEYIEECIVSCINQSYKNLEIILFDNYSNDNTKKILEKYSDKIKIIYKNKVSEFPALNQIDLIKEGLKLCKGDIICLLDGDDYFFKEKILKINNIFEKNDFDVVYDLPMIKKSNELIKFNLKRKFQKNIWPTIINTSAISIRKKSLEKFIQLNLFENYNLLEIDFRINVVSRCIDNNYFIFDESLSVYRFVPNSIMSDNKKYSKKWWFKRLQAHNYMKKIYELNNKVYSNFFDLKLTNLITKILN
tara:strand:- start:3986 stop:4759 length:774 start_codon:yes stop_codon:yes gene_type:complete